MIEYGFAENVDFTVMVKNVHDDTAFGGHRVITDHALSLDMAKELSMIQRTDKGKQARQYFIEMEKRAKQSTSQFQVPETFAEALQLAANQAAQLEKQQPVVDYYHAQMHNPGLMTTTEIAKEYGRSARWLNILLAEQGVIYKQGKVWVMKQRFAQRGYSSYDTYAGDQNDVVHNLLKWTQRGKKFIYDLLKQKGISPIVEANQLMA